MLKAGELAEEGKKKGGCNTSREGVEEWRSSVWEWQSEVCRESREED